MYDSKQILSVSDYVSYINQVLAVTDGVAVQGEISKCTLHPTGVYITLRDKADDTVLSCYMNPHAYRGLGLPLEAGMEAKVFGGPSIFRRRSELSFRIEHVELAGEGSLKKAYDLLKKQLELEGLFDRKRDIPTFIKRIGIITSKSGAVIGDFRQNLETLGYQLYLKDCRVEGAQAVTDITRALKYFNNKMPDLDCLVIMRGGGSLEDLQAFNNEQVVRALFASPIPTIAAIGHDRDVPLACLVADSYTSTPTAAATLINTSWQSINLELPRLEDYLINAYANALSRQQHHIRMQAQLLSGFVRTQVSTVRNHIQTDMQTMREQLQQALRQSRNQLQLAQQLLKSTNPERNLKLGYSIVRDASGKIVRSITQTHVGQGIRTQLADGTISATINSTDHD